MPRLGRFGGLSFIAAVVAACSSLIGLDELEPDTVRPSSGDASRGGASGGVGKGGKGGKGGSSAGKGGKGGSAGQPSLGGDGGSGAEGGDGTPGVAGAAGALGDGSGPDSGFPVTCSELHEIDSLELFSVSIDEEEGAAEYSYVLSPNFGGVFADILRFQFYTAGSYDGEHPGIFVIDGSDDANFMSCSRCLIGYEDDADLPNFMAMGGTITVATDSAHMNRAPRIKLSGITLVESTVMATPPYLSEPVDNPRCLRFEHAVLDDGGPPIAAGWTCPASFWFDGYCDCGCGARDTDCKTGSLSECFDCYCATDYTCSVVEPNQCVPL